MFVKVHTKLSQERYWSVTLCLLKQEVEIEDPGTEGSNDRPSAVSEQQKQPGLPNSCSATEPAKGAAADPHSQACWTHYDKPCSYSCCLDCLTMGLRRWTRTRVLSDMN